MLNRDGLFNIVAIGENVFAAREQCINSGEKHAVKADGLQRANFQIAPGIRDHEGQDKEDCNSLDDGLDFSRKTSGKRNPSESAQGTQSADDCVAVEEDADEPERDLDHALGERQQSREAEDAVGHRVEEFAKIGHFILAASKRPIEGIGELGNTCQTQKNVGQPRKRDPHLLGIEINGQEKRAEEDSGEC